MNKILRCFLIIILTISIRFTYGQTFNDLNFENSYSSSLLEIKSDNSYYYVTGVQSDTFSLTYMINRKFRPVLLKLKKNGIIEDTVYYDTIGYNKYYISTIIKNGFLYSFGITNYYNDTQRLAVIKKDTNFNTIQEYVGASNQVNPNIFLDDYFFENDSLLVSYGYYYTNFNNIKPFIFTFNFNSFKINDLSLINEKFIPVSFEIDTLKNLYYLYSYQGYVYVYDSSFVLKRKDSLYNGNPNWHYRVKGYVDWIPYKDSLKLFCGKTLDVNFDYNTINFIYGLAVVSVDSLFKTKDYRFFYADSLTQIVPSFKHSIIRENDNSYVFCGTISDIYSFYTYGVFIVKTDSNLNLVWQKQIRNDYLPSVMDAISTSDGGVLVLYTYVDTIMGDTRTSSKLIKIGSNGEVTTIYKFKGVIPSAPFKLYPNPATDLLKIEFYVNQERSVKKVHIFDIQGKTIMQKEISGKKSTIKIGDLSKGIYILEVITENGLIYTGKFVKE